MINRLRKKFICITMGSVALVLIMLMGIINVTNYVNADEDASGRLKLLADNNGQFPKNVPVSYSPAEDVPASPAGQRNFSPETPYETRYFSVELNADGSLISVNTSMIAAVSTKDAASMAQKLCEKGKTSGYYGNYKFLTQETTAGVRYIFLDCTRNLYSVKSFLVNSIVVSTCGIVAVFVLVMALSRRAIRPVAESYDKQKRFITDAGHEIKTPLTIIDSCTEVIEMEQGETKWTSGIRGEVKRLTALTQSLVSLARMDEQSDSLEMVDFDLSKTVNDALEPFELLTESGGLRLKKDVQPGVIYHGNEQALRQLCTILVDNAIKYSTPGGEVCISLQKKRRKVLLSSLNGAAGLQLGNMDVLFDRFYRGDASRSSEKGGYGIGLSMAQSIVAAHGGRISAESEDGMTLSITAML